MVTTLRSVRIPRMMMGSKVKPGTNAPPQATNYETYREEQRWLRCQTGLLLSSVCATASEHCADSASEYR